MTSPAFCQKPQPTSRSAGRLPAGGRRETAERRWRKECPPTSLNKVAREAGGSTAPDRASLRNLDGHRTQAKPAAPSGRFTRLPAPWNPTHDQHASIPGRETGQSTVSATRACRSGRPLPAGAAAASSTRGSGSGNRDPRQVALAPRSPWPRCHPSMGWSPTSDRGRSLGPSARPSSRPCRRSSAAWGVGLGCVWRPGQDQARPRNNFRQPLDLACCSFI